MSFTSPFIPADTSPWEVVGDGVRRRIMAHNADLMMVYVEFEAGAIGSLHTHPNTQCSYVTSGRFEVTINGDSRAMEAGDSFYVEPNLAHGVRCLEAGVLVDAFNPARMDFGLNGQKKK